jgi:hypothetical protein
LNLNADIEALLIALAQSSGVSVEDFLRHLVEEKSEHSQAQRLTPEQWAAQLKSGPTAFRKPLHPG